jgi:hypothetical protein
VLGPRATVGAGDDRHVVAGSSAHEAPLLEVVLERTSSGFAFGSARTRRWGFEVISSSSNARSRIDPSRMNARVAVSSLRPRFEKSSFRHVPRLASTRRLPDDHIPANRSLS